MRVDIGFQPVACQSTLIQSFPWLLVFNCCHSLFYINMKTVSLNGTNASMPLLGLGTWQAKVDELEVAILTALNSGYRHIDTAFNYNNEEVIGKILKNWLTQNNVNRNELFITTKLPHVGNRATDVEKFLKLSLERLQLDYVDLYLIHVPFGFKCNEETLLPVIAENGDFELDFATDHNATWKAMEDAMNKGLTKNIGVSNFNEKQIENICRHADIQPQVLQVECHAYLQQGSLRKFCSEKKIVITAYSPLGSPGARNHFMSKYNYELQNCPDLLNNPVITKIAADRLKNPSHILLRFLVQNNIAVIPKSSNPQRIKENIEIFDFELSADEIESIRGLDMDGNGRIIDFYFWKGVQNHPCYPF